MVEKKNSEKKDPDDMGDEKSPSKTEQQKNKRTGKGFTYEVVLLDGEHVNFELDKNADGRELFDRVCQHLDLQEKDYFGLQYVDERLPHHMKCWLAPEKKISSQKKRGPWLFDFALKFYPPDPTQLRESLTRWLVTLQTRRDILSGKLPATFLTQAMLGSYCVQADVGDYDPTEHHGIDYIKDIPFAPNQTAELLEKIVELHRQHKGQTPDEAELNFLENSKKLSMYGVDLHQAEDINNVEIMLGVCASGLQVYREKLRMSRFVWPKILKISYKRKQFYIKVRPTDDKHQENSVMFKLKSHRLAKRLWKICVEHHTFFRLREAEANQNSAMFPRLGSKFRYSGRTLYQARHSSQILDRPDPYFERSQPARGSYMGAPHKSKSVDELSNRPDYWKDDNDVKMRPGDKDGRDKRDHMGQPTVISQVGLPAGMKPYGDEEGNSIRPGEDGVEGEDRRDRLPGDNDATLERKGHDGDTMGLTPAELQKKAKEDEKERKKREKEEEKRRKKEEEDRKKAEKAAKKKGGKGLEDRKDELGAGDNTEEMPGRTPGTYGDEHGGPMFEAVLPISGADDKDKTQGRDGEYPEHGRWSPGRGWVTDGGDPRSPTSEVDRTALGPYDGEDFRAPGRDGEMDGYRPGTEAEALDRYAPGKDGDTARLGPGYEGGKGSFGPAGGQILLGSEPRNFSPGPGEGKDGVHFAPGENGHDEDAEKHGPGFVRFGSGRESDDKKGKKGKKERKGSDKDDDKKGKKGSKKDRKGSENDEDKDGHDDDGEKFGPGFIRFGSGRESDDKKGKKGKKERKDSDKDEDGKKKDKKGGGLFGKFKKPKDSKSKLAEAEAEGDPTADFPYNKDVSQVPKAGGLGVPDSADAAGKDKKGAGYPGYGYGLGAAGDMSMAGVVGEESSVDNKQRFEPIVQIKKESKDSLTASGDFNDSTMPFFSPAACSTFGRPGKVPPPVPPKHNSFHADDSFSRTDVYKTEKDGIQETRVEHKVVLSSTDDDFDYDAALAEAIRSVTEFNPDMSVERIECVQQIEEVKDK